MSSSSGKTNGLRKFLSDYLRILLGFFLGLAIKEAVGAVSVPDAFSGRELQLAVEARCRDAWNPYYAAKRNGGSGPESATDRFSWPNPLRLLASSSKEVEGIESAAKLAPIPRRCSPTQDQGCALEERMSPKEYQERCQPSFYVADTDIREGLVPKLLDLRCVRWFQSLAVLAFLVLQAWHVWRGLRTIEEQDSGNIVLAFVLLGYLTASISIGSFAKPIILHGSIGLPLLVFLNGWFLFDIATAIASARSNGGVTIMKYIWLLTDLVGVCFVLYFLNWTGREEASFDQFITEKFHEALILLGLAAVSLVVFASEVSNDRRPSTS